MTRPTNATSTTAGETPGPEKQSPPTPRLSPTSAAASADKTPALSSPVENVAAAGQPP